VPTLTKRSVIDMGQGSYIITLPKSWVRYYQLEPGDRLEVIADGNLRIWPPKAKRKHK
jgi:bifunctional DNA-binding transcriptional regulator/antitoxin component of YhaV-PrlF toxin-antitoxin module